MKIKLHIQIREREGGRQISDIVEITNFMQIEGILLTVDIEKDFDSANYVNIEIIDLLVKEAG